MKKIFIALAALSVAPVYGVEVVRTIVRQQWPWDGAIKVEYLLSGMNGTADLWTTATADGMPVDPALLRQAIVGETYGVDDEVGCFYIDPNVLFGSEKATVKKFSVSLSATNGSKDLGEVLYKIFDLTDGSHVDVTRKKLLNREYGDIETDFAKVGEAFGVSGFQTSLDDVLIWTGVTNYPGARTTKLVMRKVPAKGKSFTMGRDDASKHQVSFTNDYYVGVFELTVGQLDTLATHVTSGGKFAPQVTFTNEVCRELRPCQLTQSNIRRWIRKWPSGGHAEDASNYSALHVLRQLVPGVMFDLPTEAQWEYACRAGTESAFNCGVAGSSDDLVKKLGRFSANSGYNAGFYSSNYKADGPETGTAIVGSYAPNAWGLYDMHGNLQEMCLDYYQADITSLTGDDPWGPDPGVETNNSRLRRGGAFCYARNYLESGVRMADSAERWHAYMGARLFITVYE